MTRERAICAACLVTAECREAGWTEFAGWWSGISKRARRATLAADAA